MDSYEDLALAERLAALPDTTQIALVPRATQEQIRLTRDGEVWRTPKDDTSLGAQALSIDGVVNTARALDADVVIPDWLPL